MSQAAADLLVSRQNADGGWGWRPGQSSNTECTSLGVLVTSAWSDPPSTGDQAHQRAVAWLSSRQRPDGSWPMSDAVPDASWMSALATIALADVPAAGEHAVSGAGWLLGRVPGRPSWLTRAWQRLLGDRVVAQDPDLQGWPWTADTTAWVEPTSWSLLAVRKLAPRLPAGSSQPRIRQAELMLLDRMCKGGGWNYGNSSVLGSALDPFPDTTALALIALQRRTGGQGVRASVALLPRMIAAEPTLLVLALGKLALQIFGQDVSELAATLRLRLESPGPLDTRSLALALLALDPNTMHFRDGGRA